jgi:hypothetical protein
LPPGDGFHQLEPTDIGLSPTDAERVVCFAVPLADGTATLRVRAGGLLAALGAVPVSSSIVVLSGLDTPTDSPVGSMVGRLVGQGDEGDQGEQGVQAVVRHGPATSAVKRIKDGLVVESVDRANFSTPRPPEVIDRRALESALATVDEAELVNPAQLVARRGGTVVVFDEP